MKHLFATFLFLILGMPAFAQLDSVQVQVSFQPQTVQAGDSTLQVEMLQARVWVNDFDFLGQVMVSVYDQATNTPLARVKYTAAEITAQNLQVNGWIKLDLGAPTGNLNLRVETQVTNFAGAYHMPVISFVQNY